MCERLGAVSIQEPIRKMNYECAVMLFDKQTHRAFNDIHTHYWVKRLWKNYIKETLRPRKSEAPMQDREIA
ncbi:MAG TPA: hypothetical protein VF412_15860, partial [Bdellovibrio sp.]